MAFTEETANTPAGGGIRWYMQEGAELAIASTVDVSGYNGAVTFTGSGTISQLDGLADGDLLLFRVGTGATLAFGTGGNIASTASTTTFAEGGWYMLWNNGGVLYPFALPLPSPFTISSGNVGIGTTTPAVKLAVYDTSPAIIGNAQVIIYGTETTGAIDTGGGIVFGGHDGSAARGWSSIHGMKENATVGNYASYLKFGTKANGGSMTEQMRITSAGNVGIGTTTPGTKLDVAGSVSVKGGNSLSIYRTGNDRSMSLFTDGVGGAIRQPTNDTIRIEKADGTSLVVFGSGGEIKERSRTVAMGEWTAFTTYVRSAAWTLGTVTYAYSVIGKTCNIALQVSSSTITGAPTSITITLPFTCSSTSGRVPFVYYDGAAYQFGHMYTQTSSNVLTFTPSTSGASFAATATFQVYASLTLPIS